MPPQSYTKPGLLLCEGKNDQHVIWALCEAHGISETFSVQVPSQLNGTEADGIDAVLASIPGYLKRTEIRNLGILIDADDKLEQRWQRLRQVLTDESKRPVLPPLPLPEGTVVQRDDTRRVGAWLMPDNRLHGKLEDFLLALAPDRSNNPQLSEVDAFLPRVPPPRFEDKDLAKARIHAFLAVQAEPGKPLGQAVTARYLRPDAPTAAGFVDWLRKMFQVA